MLQVLYKLLSHSKVSPQPAWRVSSRVPQEPGVRKRTQSHAALLKDATFKLSEAQGRRILTQEKLTTSSFVPSAKRRSLNSCRTQTLPHPAAHLPRFAAPEA